MSTQPTETLHEEHAHLAEHVDHIRLAARELPGLSPEERTELLARILEFLHETLIPHAEAEERGLYKGVERLLGSDQATAPMTYDHRAIRELIDELAKTPVDDLERLQELLYGLHALITVHFRKEEELYLPLVDALWAVGTKS